LDLESDKFTKFKESNGNFKESLISYARGMLSLYEATHLRVHGEAILNEALVFSATHLKSMATHLSSPLAAQVSHALKQPIHIGIQRLEARRYFLWMPKISAPYRPRINPQTGWIRAGFVCVGDVEPKTLLQVW
jgi:hypothetical protein